MVENSYIALLDHDKITINHPILKKPVQLYRIIATKSFKLPKFNIVVEKYDIGGYVQSLNNIDPNSEVWVNNTARIFDDAKIIDGSYICNNALVFGSAVVKNSLIENFARIHGKSYIENSHVKDQVEIKDSAKVIDSTLKNSTKICNNAHLINTFTNKGVYIHGNAIVSNSDIADISEIRGDAEVENCKLQGRVVITTGHHISETINKEPQLKVYQEVDPETHNEYKVEPK